MKILSPSASADLLEFAFGAEEAMILFAPGGLFRSVAAGASWRVALRFFAPPSGASALLLVMPRIAIRGLLAGVAGHPAEQELKQLLFDAASPADWPAFASTLHRSISP